MVARIENKPLEFYLPKILECAIPTEERGIDRDEVRIMISHKKTDEIAHDIFRNITTYLRAGDVLVVNTSGTLNAAVPIVLPNNKSGRMHLSTQLNPKEWIVEFRQIIGKKTKRFFGIQKGHIFEIPGGGSVKVLAPFYNQKEPDLHLNLWRVEFFITTSVESYLEKNGIPIRYADVHNIYPNSYYQTVFADQIGSAEMPSAGRAFTTELVTKLVSKGIQFAPILLHTGVASLEMDEKPYPEYFEVSEATAHLINQAKSAKRRIIGVGTTAIRAVESATQNNGKVKPSKGFTNLFITPDRGLKTVNGLLTGFHEPKASHLLMLEALADNQHLKLSYEEAIRAGYQWHEFGDLHLMV